MINLEIVLKLSGFCNFRCAYCYEFDRLSDPTRMSPDRVARIAAELGAYATELALRSQTSVVLTFVLHGGEPLILPLSYLEEVTARLRTAEGPGVSVRLAVQTNAYRIRPAVLDLLRRNAVGISVSHDVIVGSRVTAAGQPVEAQVDATLRALHSERLLRGGITVLHRTSAPHLAQVHRYWRDLGVRYRLLPLFRNSGPRAEIYGLDEAQAADALAGLCAHLLDAGEAIDMSPLREAVTIALVHIAGLAVRNVGRLDFGRTAFVINTDGGVYDQTATDYSAADRLGDLTRESFKSIVTGSAIRRLHARDDALEASRCGGCRFNAACSRWPLMVEATDGPRCGVTHLLVQRLVALFAARGIARDEARSLLGVENLPAAAASGEREHRSQTAQAGLTA